MAPVGDGGLKITRSGYRRKRSSHDPSGDATSGPDFPKLCRRCGRKVLTSKQGFQDHTDAVTGERWRQHVPNCPLGATA